MENRLVSQKEVSIKPRISLADHGPILALILLVIIGSVMSPAFLTKGNIFNVLTQISVLGIGALGMTYMMIAGFIDLSIFGVLSLINVLFVGLQRTIGTMEAVIIMILIGLVMGLINGTILRLIKGDFGASIMITYGTGTIFGALALMYTHGFSIRANDDPFFLWFGTGQVLGIPVPIVILFVCAVIFHIVLRYTTFGRSLYLTGANPEAARLSGIPIDRIRTIAFMVSGASVALGGLIVSSQTVSASPVVGTGYEINVIAAVAIGGTSLNGGEGTIIRTIIGVLLIGVLSNLFIMVGLSTFDQMMAKGLIIIAALIMDKRKQKGIRKG
ncbi:ABC transporter permease [Ferviditalea candida]|uniref:ABC transporter permease n=1 Tax=Ferviditalea candida TaxID=3108399 RepID=A0ABU5ZDJ7_9BACL|nr:ABC transporter permease [Paenibacillaceae bacterium T2]